MDYRISRKLLACAIIIPSLLVFLAFYVPEVKSKSQLAKAISRVHYTTKVIETYVNEHGMFPTNFEALEKAYEISPNVLAPSNYGNWQYYCPNTNTPDHAPIIVVTYNGSAILVDKTFTRRVISAYYKERAQ